MSIASQLTEALVTKPIAEEDEDGHMPRSAKRRAGTAKLRKRYKDDPQVQATLDANEFAEEISEALLKLLRTLPKGSGKWKAQYGNALHGKGYYGKVKIVVVGKGVPGRKPMGQVMKNGFGFVNWDAAKESPKKVAKRAFDYLRSKHDVGPVPPDWKFAGRELEEETESLEERTLSDADAKAMRAQVKRNAAKGVGGKKYRVGSKVKLKGKDWVIAEVEADSSATDGVMLVLVSPDYKTVSRTDPKALGEDREPLIDLHIPPPLSEVSEGGFKHNACSTPLAKARAFTEEVFKKAGKDLDKEIPNFDSNYMDLQRRCKKAKNIPRVQMPVIEPADMDEFHKALTSGRLDIFKPWAKGKLYTPTNLKKNAEGEEFVTLGLKDGKKSDDVVRAKWTSVSANRLLPTQSQIWLDKLATLIAKFGVPSSGSPITKATLIVSKEGYILDGHHRFGQAILANPKLRMRALVIPMPISLLLKIGRSYGNAIGNQQKA